MFRGFSSLLGLFFFTAGLCAVASLTKAPVAVLPPPPPRDPDASAAPRGRYRVLQAPVFHARFSLN